LHKHLKRLPELFEPEPLFFITTCVRDRRPLLADAGRHGVLRREWEGSLGHYGWAIGSYIVMPDHVHFFCRGTRDSVGLSRFAAKWKEPTSKALVPTGVIPPIWQRGFFDHLLRSGESYSEKWEYVRHNPVRAGLVARPEDWPFQGYVHFL